MKRKSYLGMALVMAAALLAGCGNSSGAETESAKKVQKQMQEIRPMEGKRLQEMKREVRRKSKAEKLPLHC